MDIRKVKKLIELLDESGLAEIEIKQGDDSVRISRHAQGAPPRVSSPASAPAPIDPPPAAGPAPEDEGMAVTAPMVGTFYATPSPGASPYVQVGDRVSAGDTLCIIEAMKMMNQIEAEVGGVVKSIRIQNGEPVEYGQTLMVIDQRSPD